MPSEVAGRFRAAAAVALATLLQLTGASDVLAQGSNLVANPLLARELPPPGWLADHHDAWVQQHPVYQATCQTPDVTTEIHFLNRIVGHDEYLLTTTTRTDQNDPVAARQARLAREMIPSLRGDVAIADALVAQLQALPACPGGVAANSAAASPAPPPSPPEAASALPAPERLVIRFDDRLPALTPSGIRTFDQAVDAVRAGKKLLLAIEGCEAGADFSRGSVCAQRLSSLKQLLSENGIRDPKRLFSDPR